GRNCNTHMDMIGQDMPFDDLTLLLARQRLKDRAQLPAELPLQLATAALRNTHKVVRALPFRMRQALITVFQRSSFGCLIKPPEEDRTIPASVKPLQVALVEPVAYPSVQLSLTRCEIAEYKVFERSHDRPPGSASGACSGSSPQDRHNGSCPPMVPLRSTFARIGIGFPHPHIVRSWGKDSRSGGRSRSRPWPLEPKKK